MRTFLLLIFLLFLFLFTCTENLHLLLTNYSLNFRFNPSPNAWTFFNNDLIYVSDPSYISQKLGHTFYFFLLAGLIFHAWKSIRLVFLISLAAALSSEVAQLYFSRSGRLLDVGYDLAGMLLFVGLFYLYCLVKLLQRNNNARVSSLRTDDSVKS